MYEVWLMMNIAWEIAQGAWPWLLGAALLWSLLLGLAWSRRPVAWRASLPAALAAAGVAGGVAFVMLPGLVQSALTEMGYWVDWAMLAGLAAGAGSLALAFAWPLLSWRRAGQATPR